MEERKKNRDIKLVLFKDKSLEFRNVLAKIDKSHQLDKQKVSSLENDLAIREQQIKELEKHCGAQQASIDGYLKRINELEFNKRDLENDLTKCRFDLQQKDLKLKQFQSNYREKHKQEMQSLKAAFKRKLKNVLEDLDLRECLQREKKQMVMDILEAESLSIFKDLRESIYHTDIVNDRNSNVNSNQQNQNPNAKASSDKKTPQKQQHQSRFELAREKFESRTDQRENRKRPAGTPVANPRHKRSLSSGSEKWIDHQPLGTIDLGTVFTPKIKNRKSVTNLRKLSTNDLVSASKYALTHHVAAKNGDVETHIYKGDVIPTSAGGAQIMFNDVEMLHQSSPPKK